MHLVLDHVIHRARIDEDVRLEDHHVEVLQRLGDVEQDAGRAVTAMSNGATTRSRLSDSRRDCRASPP